MNKATILNDLAKLISQHAPSTLFVHSDSFKTLNLIKISSDPITNLVRHWETLSQIANGASIWFPAFNYQFPKTHTFDLQNSRCEVGALPEYIRTDITTWRTIDPIFSITGSGEKPQEMISYDNLYSFGPRSIFAELYQRKSGILFYGADIKSATILHHVEAINQVPYRYDKTIFGTITSDKMKHEVSYTSHFRPMGKYLEYDWKIVLDDLIHSSILVPISKYVSYAPVSDLVDFWMDKMSQDQLYFLNKSSRSWVAPMLQNLGRRFLQSDFE